MKYRYPKISNVLTYRRVDEHSFEVVNHLTDNKYVMGNKIVRYVRKLDGFTHPYKIQTPLGKEEIDNVIKFLDENDLIRHSDTVRDSFGTILTALWIPKRTTIFRPFARKVNTLLMFLWAPVLIAGIVLFAYNAEAVEFNGIWTGFFLGLFFGTLFHELGHFFAGVSYRARVFEMGVMLTNWILPGAYVFMDGTRVKKRFQRIQIHAAGVEMNFLLCGVFLALGACFPLLGGVFLAAAICNGFLGLINLTFMDGLDGTSIVSDLLGVEDFVDCARNIVFNSEAREKIICRDPGGYATVAVCYILFVLQIVLPVILVSNVLEVVACFV